MQERDRESQPLQAPVPLRGSGTGARLWLVRHAEVHEDWQGRAYGNLDVPLSAQGAARTGELALELARTAPALVVSSPLERALCLGRSLERASAAPLAVDARLAEICRGSWQGLAVSELHQRFPDDVRAFYADPWSWCGHGGENDAAVFARAAAAVGDALARAEGGDVVLATHYNVIRVLTARALEVAPERSFGLRVDPAHLVCLRDGPQGWELLQSNAHAPLSDGADAPPRAAEPRRTEPPPRTVEVRDR